MDKYIKILNTTASTLDALISAGGEITRLANGITEGNDEEKSTTALLKQINLIIDSNEYSKEAKKQKINAPYKKC